LLRGLQDPWYRFALGLLRDGELAREAVQETAVRFLAALPAYRGESSPSTWSMGIVLNVVREIRRRESAAPDGRRLAGAAKEPVDPLDRASADEEIGLLRVSLRGLPERQQEAVLLRFFEDLSVEQTAEAMRCAPGTVKATVHQALKALRQKMRQWT
jgi:RNA polymerase sigma factor (sigma-70 family)